MSVRTVFLPPAPARPGLAFDSHQFKRTAKMVTKENGISFGDASGMRVRQASAKEGRDVPPWAKSDAKMKLIVVRMLWAMVHMTNLQFPQEEYDTNPLALAFKLEEQLRKRCINFAVQRSKTQQNGVLGQKRSKHYGYARLLTRVFYQRYRLLKNSSEISGEMHGIVSPCGVRQLIARANATARIVLDEADNLPFGKRASDAARSRIAWKRGQIARGETKRGNGRRKYNLPTNVELFQMVHAGRTATDLAEEYGVYREAMMAKIRAGRKDFFDVPRPARKITAPQIFGMYKEGCTIEEIAQTGNLPLAYVVCILQNRYDVADPFTAPSSSEKLEGDCRLVMS